MATHGYGTSPPRMGAMTMRRKKSRAPTTGIVEGAMKRRKKKRV